MSGDRRDIYIPSHGEKLHAWFYPTPQKEEGRKPPVVVMAHGLGGVKEMRLDAFAERFSEAGLSCLVFDYRFFGQSTGKPRGLIDIADQLEDWKVAIEFAGKMDEVDPDRIALFGSSFSGGHVIKLAAELNDKVKATVSQCPFTSGFASAPTVGLTVVPRIAFHALRDLLFGSKQNPAAYVPLVADPGQTALLNAADCVSGYKALLKPGQTQLEVEQVPARIGFWLSLYRPGAYAKRVKTPIYFAICGKDTVAPAGTTLSFAKQAPKGTPKVYKDMGHFDVYVGDAFDVVTKDYTNFYRNTLLKSKL
jgi:hypothetical protein